MNVALDQKLADSYLEENSSIRIRHTKVGCILTLICMPGGAILDWFVYRELLWLFFELRILASLLVFGLFGLLYTPFGQHHIRPIGLIWILILNGSFCYMIYLTEGPNSPYYAGLSLIILGVAVLLPWTTFETFLVCAVSLGLYFLSCRLNLIGRADSIEIGTFFNNFYFLSLTSLICVVGSHFYSRARFRDFLLRHELDVRNRKLQELDRMKSEFFANVSHELRTPLTLILTPVEDLMRKAEELPSKVREALGLARQNALRLLKLINDLLDTIRLEEGGLSLTKETVNLSTYVPGIVDSVRHLGGVKDLRIETEGRDDPLLIGGDPNRLEKVFLNLLSNAIKFTPPGGVITTRWKGKNGMAVVEVEDTGIGVSREDLPRIFDRFHQADGSSTKKYQGVGIGLALVRELVDKHGGRLTAESEVGKGTLFRMEFPLLRESELDSVREAGATDESEEPFAKAFRQADRIAITESPSSSEDLRIVGEGEKTVLVVDDEPDMRRYLVSQLAENFRVVQAADGESGLELARKERPDLALLDWMLPGMDGLQVCRELRAKGNNEELKIILLTARVDEASKIKALEEGADDFLTKPFSTIEVKTRIANLLRTAQLQKDLKVRNRELEETLRKLKETESQLVQSEKMRALGTLAAGLLHEINNPLNYTLTALQVGLEYVPESDEELKETLMDIQEGMERISGIVSDLHTFAYPDEAGKVNHFSLVTCLESALRLVSHELKGISIENELDRNATVFGSEQQIVHVFMNLLVNASLAAKAVPEESAAQIRVSDSRKDGRVTLKVWDNGTGMEEAVKERIFEPFYTTRDVGEGIGLGLSICHTIVKNHGGTLHARSEKGNWTEFTFDLPLSESGAATPNREGFSPPHIEDQRDLHSGESDRVERNQNLIPT